MANDRIEIPQHELWLHQPAAWLTLQQALVWVATHTPRETTLEELPAMARRRDAADSVA